MNDACEASSGSAWYMQYRDMLLKAGFSEAERRAGHFYRQAAEQTAFIINLYDADSCVRVVYGFASTAYVKGDEEFLSRYGSDDSSCQLRNLLSIRDSQSEDLADQQIRAFYARYKDYPKDEILKLKKERQKIFLDHFSRALKPLGFQKKRTRWTKALSNGLALTLEAQKSAFSDAYYFNVVVHKPEDFSAQESNRRVILRNSSLYNWQLMTEEEIEELIQYSLTNYIIPKLSGEGS